MNWSRSVGAVSTRGMPGTSWRPKLCVDPRTCSTTHRSTSLDWSRGGGVQNAARSICQDLGRCRQGHSQACEKAEAPTRTTVLTVRQRRGPESHRSGIYSNQVRQKYDVSFAQTHRTRAALEFGSTAAQRRWRHLVRRRQPAALIQISGILSPLRGVFTQTRDVAETTRSPRSPRIPQRPVYRRASTAGSVSSLAMNPGSTAVRNHGSRALSGSGNQVNPRNLHRRFITSKVIRSGRPAPRSRSYLALQKTLGAN